jgi:hypothetical protein
LALAVTAVFLDDFGTADISQMALKDNFVPLDPKGAVTWRKVAIDYTSITGLAHQLDSEYVISTQDAVDGMLVLYLGFGGLLPIAKQDSSSGTGAGNCVCGSQVL